MQGLPTQAAYLEDCLDKGLADAVQYNDELAHLYLRMTLQGPAGSFLHTCIPMCIDVWDDAMFVWDAVQGMSLVWYAGWARAC